MFWFLRLVIRTTAPSTTKPKVDLGYSSLGGTADQDIDPQPSTVRIEASLIH